MCFSLFNRWNSCDEVTFNLSLDGVPLCFMLRRFSRPNRARKEGPVKIGRLRRMNALLLGLESFC
jgi:hypothetical protein